MMIAIHQPNFLPWLPFFSKMQSVDKFVIMGQCQFEKNGYQNRFFYRDSWNTLSVHRGMGPIVEKKYVRPHEDWVNIKRKLHDKSTLLSKFDSCISENLFETNVSMILSIARQLEIQTEIVVDEPCDLKSSERLISICRQFGAEKYLAGSGGKNYMDIEKFEKAGIQVFFQEVNLSDKIHVLDVLKE